MIQRLACCLSSLALVACGSAPPPASVRNAEIAPVDAVVDAAVVRGPAVQRNRLPPPSIQDGDALGVDVLRPTPEADDQVVATVGGLEIRKSHIYDRMLENDRRRAATWLDLLVLDCVVAGLAEDYGVVVTRQEIETLVGEEEELLRGQVEIEWGDRLPFDDYLDRQFGLSVDEYRQFLRIDLARVRYRSLVMRYLALREDRVEVRFIVHRDPAVLEDLRQKVAAGADFATLARRWSEDDSRRDGGRMAPFGRAFRHPIAATAFSLEPGEVSAVVPFDSSEGTRHAIVYCLRRMPARDRPFGEVRDEILEELERRPIAPFEQNAFTLQYCQPTQALSSEANPR